jgi:peptidyl-prolyl cis-trans isomerase A (cyclophilin A)
VRLVVLAALAAACARGPSGPYAVIETSKGRIVARLYADRAPKTVAHFRGLAEGSIAWREPAGGRMARRPLYDGTVFHRVVPDFLIQGGDPAGTGDGDPAVPIADENASDARFDRPGLLGMASWGPGTSQSQFFITLAAAPELDGRHTLFGEVSEGLDVARAISRAPRDEKGGRERPLDPPILRSLRFAPAKP